MIFSCTQKVLEKAKKYHEVAKEKPDVGQNNWYVNLLPLGRKKGLLFIHSETLYMTFLPDATVKTIKNLDQEFRLQLQEDLLWCGYEEASVNNYLEQSTSTSICKTNSRRVLGIMNEVMFSFPLFLEDATSRTDLLTRLNDMLYTYPGIDKKKEYRTPNEEMKKLLNK
ncbi:DUF6933 domain-containing protein [Flammeovirga kamogawensis]|uniref:DUF6933 domain-containing protein n=1 Tax=Flammeovirga kamogawensis TaxID=373891 RepID=A0ABX8GTJ1_9BACT|nr:hypothetical protein [Flammeovirga kamogawensis]MBB6463332.1 hypothetical protein [Flammeovirga kamogawensis]QWG06696.1 hypothetical protein KM029_15470 [Flammeovirga kamogawensis]TRX68518.1 hypothetical protein EO216_10465 [Flammeovirga kamogawensis]